MDYAPYSPEWHRKRYLKEALDKYFNDYVDTDVIRGDILSILSERSEKAYDEFERINQLERDLQQIPFWIKQQIIRKVMLMEMDPSSIELSSTSKMFAYEKLSREIEECNSVEQLKNMLRCYIKLYLKHQEVAASFMNTKQLET